MTTHTSASALQDQVCRIKYLQGDGYTAVNLNIAEGRQHPGYETAVRWRHTELNMGGPAAFPSPPTTKPILIVGAGVSGLLLAQYLRKTADSNNSRVPFRIFERDADLATRGLGWGLTLHWSLPALRVLLPDNLVRRLPEAYVDRAAVDEGRPSTFPFFDLSSGELKAKTPPAPESQRIRVSRDRLRRLLATALDIEACVALSLFLPHAARVATSTQC